MDEPVPIEGIIEGEPESLAVVCAAGGSAILAYCSAVGAQARVDETVVAALSTFRRGVVEHAGQDPAQLEKLLVASAVDAAHRVAGVDPSPVQQAAAQVALETAETAPLAPGLAPRVIRALVDAAPISALGGDAAAVRRAAEKHYVRMFDGTAAAAPAPSAPASVPSSAPARAPSRPPAIEAGWVPPELADLDVEAANARALIPAEQWSTDTEAPAEAKAGPDAPPPAPPPPGALVIKRGGHWPFRRRPRKAPRGGGSPGAKSTRNALLAGVAGLALGAGVVALAMPQEEVVQSSVLVRPLDTPFTVEGAVFNVARTNQATWAREIRELPLRSGRTWVTLAAQTRNINRASFFPRSLGYRLRTPTGIVIGPATAQVGDDVTAARGRVAPGERASVHLGFQVPSGQRGLTFEFDPVPRTGPRIRVPLN